MNANKKLELDLHDIYQLLIAECRYGYTRNNHLMPSSAYEKVRRIIPEMFKVDSEYALYTIKQICEECISDQIVWNFFDGKDDEFGNRREAIDFTKWCLDWIHEHEYTAWEPYNYDRLKANLEKGI